MKSAVRGSRHPVHAGMKPSIEPLPIGTAMDRRVEAAKPCTRSAQGERLLANLFPFYRLDADHDDPL